MPAIHIRDATLDDLAPLGDIFRRSSLTNEGDRPALIAHPEALEFHEQSLREGRTRVATSGGRVVGFATTQVAGAMLELEDLFVDPDFMRRGVGRHLVRDAAAIARRRHFSGIGVTANPHALPFYTKVGFVGGSAVETSLGAGLRMQLRCAT